MKRRRPRQTNTKLATRADGSISPVVMPDKLHVADTGYTRWMEAISPTLEKLLNEHP